ncbi:MAG TPA: hypothetical protein EYH24_02660 [Thermococcus paralvinellae]|uniref:Membrane-associated metallopeptidase n=1 Tax=Thermococcus paralvinellae TaxID=582419 RepID=A0A833E300_9EURY|nr:hypothetical protein [Thermococcus paralvinellae]
MKFWEFTRIVTGNLLKVFLSVALVILVGAAYLDRLGCLLKNPLNVGIFISVFLMIYFHEVGHYIPLRNREMEVKRDGIGITILTTKPIPSSAVILSVLLPLIIAVVLTAISRNWVFIILWLGIGAMGLIDAMEVV